MICLNEKRKQKACLYQAICWNVGRKVGDVAVWAQLLNLAMYVFNLAIFAIILATFIFALIGIESVYDKYKMSKWQREYGDKLEEDTERNRWRNMERLSDRIFLLEEIIKESGIENSMDKIDNIISEVDYDARYNAWKKNDAKWGVFALSSMSGGLGSTEKAQAETNEDFDKYEDQRKQD